MNNLKLKQLIRESINEYIKKIDKAGYIAGVKAKFDATQEAINKRKKMVELDGLDEDVQGMIDERKVKEVNNEIKALEKSLAKLKKQLEKLNSKGTKTEKPESEEKEEIVDVKSHVDDASFPPDGGGNCLLSFWAKTLHTVESH